MKKRLDNKGMTLIEVIVVLLISSVIVLIAGGILLNSMGYFNKTADTDLDKLAMDGVMSYVREELVYATDVRILENKPDESDDWHWLSLDENNLLMKDDKIVYDASYYNHKTLRLSAKRYNNDYRIDLQFTFMNHKNVQTYQRRFTLELINMKNYDNVGGSSSTVGSDLTKILPNGYKIFYKQGALKVQDDPDSPDVPDVPDTDDGSGTVADEINCKNYANDKGDYKYLENYHIGDFVRWPAGSDNWYRATHEMSPCPWPPGSDGILWWKKIDKEYNNQSQYYFGDIIIYNNLYYQIIRDPGDAGIMSAPDAGSHYWSEGFSSIDELKKAHQINPTCTLGGQVEEPEIYTGTVADEIYCRNNDNNKGWYNPLNTNQYKAGDFVQYSVNYTTGKQIFWFRLVKGQASGTAPGTTQGVWKRITKEWDNYSVYHLGDVVYHEETGSYYKVTEVNPGQQIIGIPPGPGNYGNGQGKWEKISAPIIDTPPTCKAY